MTSKATNDIPSVTKTDSSTPATTQRERIGQALMWIAAAGAVGAAIAAVAAVANADDATKMVETWRLYGFLVFAGLFALLASRPRAYPGVWELALLDKLALTVTALAYATRGGISGTWSIIVWDGALSLALIAAYVCCRGWTAWSSRTRPLWSAYARRRQP